MPAIPRTGGTAPLRGHAIALSLLALAVAGLYLPFLRSPLVFDDLSVFYSNQFAYFATHPLGMMPRAPAYFSIASVEVLFESLAAHRLVSLGLHLACAAVIYGLAHELLLEARGERAGAQPAPSGATVASALFAAGAFALHPVAVYGSGYLAQRSTVLATLFGLISLRLLLAALRQASPGLAVAAAAAYSVAVMAKEHALLLPAIAAPVALVVAGQWRARARQLTLYWLCCAPAAVFVTLMMKRIIGKAYEPHAGAGLSAGPADAVPGLTLLDSALWQMGLAGRYVWDWLWPQTARMAIDLRSLPLRTMAGDEALAVVVAFFGAAALSAWMLLRGGRLAVAAVGILYFWIHFLVEFSVLRVQEPYVLYRSFLWAPGLALTVAALLDALGARAAWAALAVAMPLLAVQARDRLETFASPLRLWEDAAEKLPIAPVPLGHRVLYAVGREYLYAGQPERALATARRCVRQYPNEQSCAFALGAIHFERGDFAEALRRFLHAADLDPRSGPTQHRIGLSLEKLGRVAEARQRYARASQLGYIGGAMELSRLPPPGHEAAAAAPEKGGRP